MAPRSFAVNVDASQLDGLADRLGRISGTSLGLGATEAVNEVTLRFSETAQAAQIADINLSPAYVKSKTDVALAVPGQNPQATITTKGTLTILGRFEPVVQLRAASVRAAPNGPRRGRPTGTQVQIRRTRVEQQPKWFTMRLRYGVQPGDDVGVFVRDAAGKKKHIYGPSPYSLFRHQIEARQDELQDDLARTALDKFGALVGEATR